MSPCLYVRKHCTIKENSQTKENETISEKNEKGLKKNNNKKQDSTHSVFSFYLQNLNLMYLIVILSICGL